MLPCNLIIYNTSTALDDDYPGYSPGHNAHITSYVFEVTYEVRCSISNFNSWLFFTLWYLAVGKLFIPVFM